MEQPAIHETLEFQNERLILIDQILAYPAKRQRFNAALWYRYMMQSTDWLFVRSRYRDCGSLRGLPRGTWLTNELSLCDGLPRHQPPNCGEPLSGH